MACRITVSVSGRGGTACSRFQPSAHDCVSQFRFIDMSLGCVSGMDADVWYVWTVVAWSNSGGARDIDLTIVTSRQLEKLWDRIDVSVGLGPKGDCHIWCGFKVRGYGKFEIGRRTRGTRRNVSVSRLIWKLHHPNESLPPDIFICHTCDNPPCVNVAHLFPGTPQQNSKDMVRKGRQAKGDRNGSRLHPERLVRGDEAWLRLHPEKVLRGIANGNSKLTEADIVDIRASVDLSQGECARDHGVSQSLIHAIRSGGTWTHVGGILPLSSYRHGNKRRL